MEKIIVTQIDAYSWECPKCKVWHVTDKYANLVCQNCGEEYEVDHVNM